MTHIEETAGPSGKSQLLLLIGIALLATLVPYVMYYTGWGIPAATVNQGVLVNDPLVVTDFHFRDLNDKPWNLAEQQPKFRLVIPVLGECEAECRDNLYVTRQVRRRLAEKSDQLERVYVQLGKQDEAAFHDFLSEEHGDVVYLTGDYQEWQQGLGSKEELEADFKGREYYLLHRYGALGLAYNREHTGNQLLDDLEFLIRTSN